RNGPPRDAVGRQLCRRNGVISRMMGRRRSMDRLLAWALKKVIRTGNLRVTTAGGSIFTAGDGTGKPLAIRFTTRRAERGVLAYPELRFGEAYMDGGITIELGSIADVLAL